MTEDEHQVDGSLAPMPTDGVLEISSGEAFTIADVDAFLCERPATVVALVGDADSGKSTLVCSIYDRALHGPFADRLSSGIRTIIALERRAHHERLDSGMQIPDTMRTPISEGLQFFHFAFSSMDDPSVREDILISDRAGELYNRARGNPEIVAELNEFPKADVVSILLDGGRMAVPEERSGAMQAVRQSLRLLSDTGAVDKSSAVQVVTTKQDLLQAAGDWNTFQTRLDEFRGQLVKDFGGRVASLEFFTVSARDPKRVLDRAFGVDALMLSWLGVKRQRSFGRQLMAGSGATEFDKLSERTFSEVRTNA